MENHYSVADVARAIVRVEAWDAKAEAKLHRQIKHWRDSGLLIPVVKDADKRGTALFDRYGVVKARFFVTCADVGLDINEIGAVMHGVEPRASGVLSSRDDDGNWIKTPYWDDPDTERWLFNRVVDRIASGESEAYYCRVQIRRDNAGNKMAGGALYSASESRTNPDDEALVAKVYEHQQWTLQAKIVIPFGDLVTPLVKSIF